MNTNSKIERKNNLPNIERLINLASINPKFQIGKADLELIIKEARNDSNFMDSLMEALEANPHLTNKSNIAHPVITSNKEETAFDLIIKTILSSKNISEKNDKVEITDIKFEVEHQNTNNVADVLQNLRKDNSINNSLVKKIKPK